MLVPDQIMYRFQKSDKDDKKKLADNLEKEGMYVTQASSDPLDEVCHNINFTTWFSVILQFRFTFKVLSVIYNQSLIRFLIL